MTQEWVVASASVPGLQSSSGEKPLQDAHKVCLIDKRCGAIVVADGAGSLANSHLGAAFVVEDVATQLEIIVRAEGWNEGTLPDDATWRATARRVFMDARAKLMAHAALMNMPFLSLGCTVIGSLFTPSGFLVAHIGDGRAAYRDSEGTWHAAMTPFQGEEVGSTAFITSDCWQGERSDLGAMEARVIATAPTAFALMSDGCERAAFLCYVREDEGEEYARPNRPYSPFLEPNVQTILALRREGRTAEQINELWAEFLRTGNGRIEALRDQSDDKTMVLGCLVTE